MPGAEFAESAVAAINPVAKTGFAEPPASSVSHSPLALERAEFAFACASPPCRPVLISGRATILRAPVVALRSLAFASPHFISRFGTPRSLIATAIFGLRPTNDIGAALRNTGCGIAEGLIGAWDAAAPHIALGAAPGNTVDDPRRIRHTTEAVFRCTWDESLSQGRRCAEKQSAHGEGCYRNDRSKHDVVSRYL